MTQGLTLDELRKRNPKRWELTGDSRMLFELEGEEEKVALACSKCGTTHLQCGVTEKKGKLVFPVLCHKCGQLQILFMEAPES